MIGERAVRNKNLFVLSAFSVATSAAVAGGRVEIPPLVEAAFADTEVSTNVAFAAGCADDLLAVRLTLAAAETNNAYALSFGTDADGDGRLAPDERGLTLGWDCGAWFVREEATGWERTLPCAAECRTFGVRLRLGSDLSSAFGSLRRQARTTGLRRSARRDSGGWLRGG